MNKTVSFAPAKTETKVVEVAPATITLVLTPEQAAKVCALMGEVSCYESVGCFEDLKRILTANGVARLKAHGGSSDTPAELPPIRFSPRDSVNFF